MRSPNNSTAGSNSNTTVDGGFRHWNSPVPYLFGGVALMLGLITVALVILACTNRIYSSSSSSYSSRTLSSDAAAGAESAGQEKPAAQVEMVVDSNEPKFVVIMAGDNRPTYLAKPVTCSSVES